MPIERYMKYLFLLLLIPTIFSFANDGGVYLGSTRIIFPSSATSESLSVTNSSKNGTWLVRSWVSLGDSDDEKNNDFIITPPLYRLDPQNTINLKINRLSDALPKNKESLFYINAMIIPPVDKKSTDSTKIQFSINNKIKMFYRPESINSQSNANEAFNKISVKKEPKGFTLKNPTPYYITLTQIEIDNNKNEGYEGLMLSPFGSEYLKCVKNCNSVKFKAINDFGGLTSEKKLNF